MIVKIYCYIIKIRYRIVCIYYVIIYVGGKVCVCGCVCRLFLKDILEISNFCCFLGGNWVVVGG